MMEKREKKSIKFIYIFLGLFLLLGMSYALFSVVIEGRTSNKISVGHLGLRIDYEQDEIQLEKAYPIEQQEALRQSPYLFDVVNDGTLLAEYALYVEIDESISTMPMDIIRYYVTVQEEGKKEKSLTPEGKILGNEVKINKDGKTLYKIDFREIDINKKNHYKLYLWVDYDATVEQAANKSFEAKVRIEGNQVELDKKVVRKIDVSVNNDKSAYAYLYGDKTVRIKGEGQIRENIAEQLVYNENTFNNRVKVLYFMGYDTSSIETIEQLENFMNNLSIKDATFNDRYMNAVDTVVMKEALKEFGHNVSEIVDQDSCTSYLLSAGLINEEGEALNQEARQLFARAEQKYNQDFASQSDLPKKIIVEEGITNIPNGLYTGNESLTKVDIPSSIVSIDNNAFAYCSHLNTIVLPNQLTNIGTAAFMGCTSLKNVTLSENLTTIAAQSFQDCTNLTTITIPPRINSIGSSAFSGCSNLYMIENLNHVSEIESYAFLNCTSLNDIQLADTLTSIKEGTFKNCTNLTTMSLPNQLLSIESEAFQNCNKIQKIVIPTSVTYVGENLFSGCSNLNSLSFSIAIANSNLFTGTTNIKEIILTGTGSISNYGTTDMPWYSIKDTLEKVVIVNGITSIGQNAFNDFTNLKDLTIPSSLSNVESNSFSNCTGVTKFTIEAGINLSSSEVKSFSSLNGVKELVFFGTGDMRNYNSLNSGNRVWSYSLGTIEKVTIKAGLTSVGSYSLSKCTALKEVIVEDTVKKIGENSFADCSNLSKIELPNSLTSIDQYAFEHCTSLKEITIPNSVSSTKYGLFNGWKSDQVVRIDNTQDFVKNNWQNGLMKWNSGCSAQIEYLR